MFGWTLCPHMPDQARRRRRVGCGALALGFILGMAAAPAHAQQNRGGTATINVRATSAARASVSITFPEGGLPEDLTKPVKDAVIARIVERSNTRHGYSVMIISENARQAGVPILLGQDGASIPYELNYGGQTLQFRNGRAVLDRFSRSNDQVRELAISTRPPPGLAPGQYADRLTLVFMGR